MEPLGICTSAVDLSAKLFLSLSSQSRESPFSASSLLPITWLSSCAPALFQSSRKTQRAAGAKILAAEGYMELSQKFVVWI